MLKLSDQLMYEKKYNDEEKVTINDETYISARSIIPTDIGCIKKCIQNGDTYEVCTRTCAEASAS